MKQKLCNLQKTQDDTFKQPETFDLGVSFPANQLSDFFTMSTESPTGWYLPGKRLQTFQQVGGSLLTQWSLVESGALNILPLLMLIYGYWITNKHLSPGGARHPLWGVNNQSTSCDSSRRATGNQLNLEMDQINERAGRRRGFLLRGGRKLGT